MTVRPPLPSHLQPASKAAPTAQSSHLLAVANSTPSVSRSSSQARPGRTRQDVRRAEVTSEKATLSLIKKVLAPDTSHGSNPRASPRPVEELLPPLTSSNEIDFQLYAIIAIIIKDFVYAWYSKITPDHAFVEEVIQIIAHCSRALEQRLRLVEIEELIFDEIPALVENHILAYRTAWESSPTSEYGSSPAQIYHTLNPHPALSPLPDPTKPETIKQQAQNEATYRQLLVQGALATLLPTEDLDNVCLRTLVGDIIADLILGQAVAGKVCEGWFLHEAVVKIASTVTSYVEPKATGEEIETDTRGRLEKFGLLSSREHHEQHNSPKPHQSLLSSIFWRMLQYAYLLCLFLRFTVVGLSQARSLPRRTHQSNLSPLSPTGSKAPAVLKSEASTSRLVEADPRPVLIYRSFSAISTLLNLAARMPWLACNVTFIQHLLTAGPGRVGYTNSLLDKFLHHTLQTQLLSPAIIPPLLLSLRTSLFPGNKLGPPAPPAPSPDECRAIRRRAAEAVLALLPPVVARTLFDPRGGGVGEDASSDSRSSSNSSDNGATAEGGGGDDGEEEEATAAATAAAAATARQHERDREATLAQIETDVLDVFADAYCTRHLVYNVLELVLVRLIPELRDTTPSALLAERGVDVGVGDGGSRVIGVGK